MSELLEKIRTAGTKKLPQHIAIIMDGNGRWAKIQGKERIYGHQHGVEAVRSVIEGCGEADIRYLTLYAFSTENWNRPEKEINALISLLIQSIHNELDNLDKNNVHLGTIGDITNFPPECREQLAVAIERTRKNNGLHVTIALSYSARWEMVEMVKKIALQTRSGSLDPQKITAETITRNLTTANMPDPDILIRTGGEYRLSNFLLWQIAYTELFFSPVMWPDFRKEDLWQIILDYWSRQRRFGKTGEQIAAH